MRMPDLTGIVRGVCWVALGFVTYILVARALNPEAGCALTGLCRMCPYESVCGPGFMEAETSVSPTPKGIPFPATQGDPQ
jgi:hypothetical protein